jgi:uncharacterized membrane protein YhaH (DUF805 family)
MHAAHTPARVIAAAGAAAEDCPRPNERNAMGLLEAIILGALAVVVVGTIIDIVRRRYSGWTAAGWIALVIVLPLIGSLIYWARRQPSPAEVEQQRLAEASMRSSAAHRPFDSTSIGP